MGKWLYINILLLLVSLVFMYLHFATYYQPPWHVYVLASLFCIILYGLGHYVFVYKMKVEVRPAKQVETKASVQANPKAERPKVVLKKERPKVDLNKKNNNKHDK
ncbi:hypothetical protein WJR50_33260 [Catalinimonas sp. 4WD22]|uniref:hypothetical protein n=1 Tax=Catalinimonas locisalis TaxID=3133978 RepID=UPI0031018724